MTRELEEKNHAFLRVLTEQPQKQDMSRFLKIMKGLDGKADREYAESILDVFRSEPEMDGTVERGYRYEYSIIRDYGTRTAESRR